VAIAAHRQEHVPTREGVGRGVMHQVTTVPLRRAAEARRFLVERAARHLNAPPAELTVTDCVVSVRRVPSRRVTYARLI
jgi:hypothetical protein